MKLSSLRIQNFRTLENFQVQKLGRVNLITGKNNSGKSSVLEALRIFAAAGNPILLDEISVSHDEKNTQRYKSNADENEENVGAHFEHFFTGRKFPINDVEISIGDVNDADVLKIEHVLLQGVEEELTSEDGTKQIRSRKIAVAKNQTSLYDEIKGQYFQAIKIRKNQTAKLFGLDESNLRRSRQFPWMEAEETTNCAYLSTKFSSIDDLADIWDTLALDNERRSFVKDALQAVCNDFEEIAFVKSDVYIGNIRRDFGRSAIVRIRDIENPIPLNSMGDGMLRVLQLILKMLSSRNGILLIDEFENGLHYSVQEKIWNLLFTLSEKFNVQIFATTHSWDCIKSFAKVATERTNSEGVFFRVGHSAMKSNLGQVIATEFSETQLRTLTQADVEVR